MGLQLRPKQREAVDFAHQEGNAYIMGGLGTGKTAIALTWIAETGIPAFVFSPLMVAKVTWPEEIHKWTPWLNYVFLHGRNKNDRIKLKRDIYLINYEGLKWLYKRLYARKFRIPPFALVLDESNWVKSQRTQRYKMLRQICNYLPLKRMCLSATPRPNGMHELWTQFNILDNGETLGTRYTHFRDKYFILKGLPPAQKTLIKSPKHREAIVRRVSPKVVRLTRQGLKLPPIFFNDIYLDLPPKVQEVYDKLEKYMFYQLEHSDYVLRAPNVTEARNKLRQVLQGGFYYYKDNKRCWHFLHDHKQRYLADIVTGLQDQQALIAYQYQFELTLMNKHVGKLPIMNSKTGLKFKSRWDARTLGSVYCHPGSVSYGLNLQKGGHHVIWSALTWSGTQFNQLNGRLHRPGQDNPIIITRLLFRDTMDIVVAEAVRKKNMNQSRFLNAIVRYQKQKEARP